MKAVHGRGQHEVVGIRTNPAFNWIRTEPPVREFSGWAGGVNVACIKENLITRVKLWCPALDAIFLYHIVVTAQQSD